MTEVLSFMNTLSDDELENESQLFRKFLYLSHVESHTPCATCTGGTLNEHRPQSVVLLKSGRSESHASPILHSHSTKPMKLFQYDKKSWDDDRVDNTWQFGIIKNKSLLWVNYERSGGVIHSSGGINILFSFLGCSLFGVDLQQQTFNLGFHFFTDYFDGWED